METTKLKEKFQAASETGKNIIILKAMEECDCFDKNDLLNSEPDPHCTKCYGTGKTRLKIITEKVRFDYITSKETTSIIENIEDDVAFYLGEIYSSINNEDIFIIPGKSMKCYSVQDTIPNIYNDFMFLEILGKKIPFLNIGDLNVK